MEIGEAIRKYHSFQCARGDSEAHRNECQRILAQFGSRAGEADVGDLEPEELQAFLAEVRARPGLRGRKQVSEHTVLAYWRTLSAFFAWMVSSGYAGRNPMARVPRPKVAVELVKPFSEEQVRRLLSQPDIATFAGLRDVALMVFLLDTGCRVSETLSLGLESLDRERQVALVRGKGRKERTVPFGPVALAWLERYLERRLRSDASGFLFVNQYGERLTRHAVARRIAAYGKAAGLRGVRASPHTFRHTFSVNWLLGDGEHTGDALSLQRLLGHSSPAMTARYVNFASADLSRLHARLSPAARLAPPPPTPKRRERL